MHGGSRDPNQPQQSQPTQQMMKIQTIVPQMQPRSIAFAGSRPGHNMQTLQLIQAPARVQGVQMGQPAYMHSSPGSGRPSSVQRLIINRGNGPQPVMIAPAGTYQQHGITTRTIAPAPVPRQPVLAPAPAQSNSVLIHPSQSIGSSFESQGVRRSPQVSPYPQSQNLIQPPAVGLSSMSPRGAYPTAGSGITIGANSSANAPPPPKMKHSDLLNRQKINELVDDVDRSQQLDIEVQDLLLQIADDFIDRAINSSCELARHRNSNTLEVKDVQLFLERNHNMWVPGFQQEDTLAKSSSTSSSSTPNKRSFGTEAHKQRMAVIKKTTRK